MMRLKDRVAIVTGGGGGIGEGICLCLAREGAHVVVSDQSRTSAERVAAEITKLGQKALACRCVFAFRSHFRLLFRKYLACYLRICVFNIYGWWWV